MVFFLIVYFWKKCVFYLSEISPIADIGETCIFSSRVFVCWRNVFFSLLVFVCQMCVLSLWLLFCVCEMCVCLWEKCVSFMLSICLWDNCVFFFPSVCLREKCSLIAHGKSGLPQPISPTDDRYCTLCIVFLFIVFPTYSLVRILYFESLLFINHTRSESFYMFFLGFGHFLLHLK